MPTNTTNVETLDLFLVQNVNVTPAKLKLVVDVYLDDVGFGNELGPEQLPSHWSREGITQLVDLKTYGR